MSLDAVASADDVLEAARHLLGDTFAPPSGVIQTCAVDRDHRVIRIGEHAPTSAWDFFMLNLARASVDAIITTGKILRDEPKLRYDLEGRGRIAPALHAYRSTHAGRSTPARVVVLTRGDVDLAHPALHGWAKPVLALPSNETPFAREASSRGIEVLVVPQLDVRALVSALRAQGQSVSIEAGPSSSLALYDGELMVDTLFISRFEGEIAEPHRGSPFLADRAIARLFGAPKSTTTIHEQSGDWTFRRFSR